jgi:hypothetical protein
MGKVTELKRVSLKVPDTTKEWYETTAKSLGLNMSQYMTIALIRYEKSEIERSLNAPYPYNIATDDEFEAIMDPTDTDD